jgi:hypothetical protein
MVTAGSMSDRHDIARVLLSGGMCVQCLCTKSALTPDRVLDALGELETSFELTRTWRNCPVCGERRGVLTIP